MTADCKKRKSAGAVVIALALIVLCLLAAGCAEQPAVAEVPVAVSCVKNRPERPAFRDDAEVLALDDYRAVVALRVERERAKKYIGELEDVVEVCDRAPSVVTVPR